jgi:hypothetical protein
VDNLTALVDAQNKTTFAVRSLLEILRIYVFGSVLIGIFVGIEIAKTSMYYTDGFWAIPFWLLAGLVAVVMLVMTIVVISKGLAGSKP